MLPQISDFRAEAQELHTLLDTLGASDWQRPTLFKSWTVNDVVQHLHASDVMAAASVAGPEPFAQLQAELKASRETGMTRLEETRHRLSAWTGRPLLERWYAEMNNLCEKLSAMPENARLKWVGPDMGLRMFTTARQMETWAHGQSIYDLMGQTRQPTDRLCNIAEIGVRTYAWTFTNRSVPLPGPTPHVRLAAPSGATWDWNEASPENAVQGSALEFCQVVTQTRNVADAGLRVTGEPATKWMSLAQCFAGPPENPPPPGLRSSMSHAV